MDVNATTEDKQSSTLMENPPNTDNVQSVMTTSGATVRKRPLSIFSDAGCPDQGDGAFSVDDISLFDSSPAPEGLHLVAWNMLKSIKRDTMSITNRVKDLDDRLLILEDQADNTGNDMAKIRHDLDNVVEKNKLIFGRLIRAEQTIERQNIELSDLRARSMRDNFIVKSKGNKYKENKDEDSVATMQRFFADELRIPDADKIPISRAHRMGPAQEGRNRMLIGKIVFDDDQRRILTNASVLKDTDYEISKQIPREYEERRQFAWATYRKARSEKRHAVFDGPNLIVDDERVLKFDPIPLPNSSDSGTDAHKLDIASSEFHTKNDHKLQTWASEIKSIQDVHDCLDVLLSDDKLAKATHIPYAFRYKDSDGKIIENFDSDSDHGIGLHILNIIRKKNLMNFAVFVPRWSAPRRISLWEKLDLMNSALAEILPA